jgi:ABC-type multidrug transport system fused ATPase/permease subunit
MESAVACIVDFNLKGRRIKIDIEAPKVIITFGAFQMSVPQNWVKPGEGALTTLFNFLNIIGQPDDRISSHVENLSFQYRTRHERAIENISFELEPGKMLLISRSSR